MTKPNDGGAGDLADRMIGQVAMGKRIAALESVTKAMLSVLTEPGVMDVDEWKAWKREVEAKAKEVLDA